MRIAGVQFAAKHVADERVAAMPLAVYVKRQQQTLKTDRLQHARRIGTLERGITERGTELSEDRRASQEGAQLGRQRLEHLLLHVVGDGSLGPSKALERRLEIGL